MAATRRRRKNPGRRAGAVEQRAYRATTEHVTHAPETAPDNEEREPAARPNGESAGGAPRADAAAVNSQAGDASEEGAELGFLSAIAHPRARAFLRHYARTGNVTEAARAAGVSRNLHYYWLEHLPGYREAAAQAEQMAADALEREAWRRAVEGWDEPVYQKGQLVGTVRRYSDVLMTLLLRGLRPERYRERVDIGSEPGRPVQVQLAPQDEEAARRLIEVMAARRLGNAESGATTGPEALR